MLAKLTSKNQITVPVELLRQLPQAEYFEVTIEDSAIVLRPVRLTRAVDLEQIRDKLAAAGVSEDAVKDAVAWARSRQ